MGIKLATESQIVTACLDLLELRGIFAWRANNVATVDHSRGVYRTFRGLKGVSDILAITPDGRGRLIAIEVKKPGGRLSPEQKLFLDAIRERGGLAFVVRSVSELDEVLAKELTHQERVT